jgi:hypothetical protein
MSTLREKVAQAICKVKIGGPYPNDERIADAALAAFRAWLADEGLAIVPKKATGAMFSAALQRDDHGDLYHGIYGAMIAAAPDALKTKP